MASQKGQKEATELINEEGVVMSRSVLQPDQIGYYGRPITSLTKEELLKAVLELSEIINNCPVKGQCSEIVKLLENHS
jgi:hypothetical protein